MLQQKDNYGKRVELDKPATGLGACSILTAFVQTKAQAAGVRFVLGIFDAAILSGEHAEVVHDVRQIQDGGYVKPVSEPERVPEPSQVHVQTDTAGGSQATPSIDYCLSHWYRRSELAIPLALYIVMAPIAGAFGGLLASAILKLPNFGTLHTWRMTFAIEGIITCVLSLIANFTVSH